MTTFEILSNVQVNKPIWSGPEDSGKNGGVTQSLLGKFLACPERFKALVIDGLKPRKKFNHKIEYGNMFHLCEEYYNKNGMVRWQDGLTKYITQLCVQYPFDQEEILKWYRVCQIQFPIYLEYWGARSSSSTSILQEEVFHVPYKLPSGRIVYLRGKWDGVSLDEGLWLDETKSKGTVNQQQIERRLKFDLQTMMYLVALRKYQKEGRALDALKVEWNNLIKGVRYNVIRRPLSGGKGTIKQTQKETIDEYYARLEQYIRDEPETYFFRWESEVSEHDIKNFEEKTLIPCLERLCAWWDTQNGKDPKYTMWASCINFTMPFGVSHVTDEYGSDYDDYVMTGSTIGLEKCNELFPELT